MADGITFREMGVEKRLKVRPTSASRGIFASDVSRGSVARCSFLLGRRRGWPRACSAFVLALRLVQGARPESSKQRASIDASRMLHFELQRRRVLPHLTSSMYPRAIRGAFLVKDNRPEMAGSGGSAVVIESFFPIDGKFRWTSSLIFLLWLHVEVFPRLRRTNDHLIIEAIEF